MSRPEKYPRYGDKKVFDKRMDEIAFPTQRAKRKVAARRKKSADKPSGLTCLLPNAIMRTL